ncbi:MAG TPA: glycosyltransferase family 39 protein [Nitrososphaera sp.]|nr:glycosyltransferase family 39 protein [Nitrososphaera sp.]
MAAAPTSREIEHAFPSAKNGGDSGGLPAISRHASTRGILLGLSLFAFAVHLLFLGLLPNRWSQNESTDYFLFYEPVAHNLIEGKGLVTSDGHPALRYPPGQPLILAGLMESARITGLPEALVFRAFIALVVMIVPILIYQITAAVFDQGIALLSSVLFAAYPFYLWLTKQPNSEIPFFLLFFAVLYIFVRSIEAQCFTAWHGLTIGGLIGIASLIRPIVLALSGVFLLALWLCQKRWTIRQRIVFSLLLVLGNALVVLPWEVWTREKTGQWILLSTNGPPSIVDGLTFAVKERPSNNVLPVSPELGVLMQEVRDRSGQLQSVAAIGGLLVRKFRQEPVAVTKLIVLKMSRAWYATDSQSHERWIVFFQAPCILFSVIGGVAAVKTGGGPRRLALLMLLVTCYFWLMTTIGLSILRYMVPAMGLLMPFASLGIIAVGRRLWKPQHFWYQMDRL